jgi:hypothetical protein
MEANGPSMLQKASQPPAQHRMHSLLHATQQGMGMNVHGKHAGY